MRDNHQATWSYRLFKSETYPDRVFLVDQTHPSPTTGVPIRWFRIGEHRNLEVIPSNSRSLNIWDRRILFLGGFLLVALCLFPPWKFTVDAELKGERLHHTELVGHRFIFTPPEPAEKLFPYTATSIDFGWMFSLGWAVILVTGLTVFFRHSRDM